MPAEQSDRRNGTDHNGVSDLIPAPASDEETLPVIPIIGSPRLHNGTLQTDMRRGSTTPRRARRVTSSMPLDDEDGLEPVVLLREPAAASRKDDPLFDPWCDAENPIEVTFEDVSAAAFMLRGGIQRTPCAVSGPLEPASFCRLKRLQGKRTFP